MKRSLSVPAGLWALAKEVGRHLLRRPVVGVAIAGQTEDGRWLLIRRGDTGEWALPGGTLEWGETLTHAAERELREEAGAQLKGPFTLAGVYSDPDRDMRFHAVTVLLIAPVSPPEVPPLNPLEIREVALFEVSQLPTRLSHRMTDMLRDALAGHRTVE